ncbi:AhpD family alkylhydroperoxidase [Bradyrhizobium elkanii]
MATVKLLSDDELPAEARAVFDDIRKTRNSDFINNFWRALAHDPKTLRRTWESIKEVMAPGALDPKVKEMLYVAVSVAHGCSYCIHSHTASARAKGMTDAEYQEMLAIVGMAAETNRLVTALGRARRRGLPRRRICGTKPGALTAQPVSLMSDVTKCAQRRI